jgi:hypothetical protein
LSPQQKAGSYEWYEIQDNVAYWQEFEKSKIVWGNLATSPQFALAPVNSYVCAPANLIVSENNNYLLAILNSKAAQYVISQNAALRQGGFLEFKPINLCFSGYHSCRNRITTYSNGKTCAEMS